MNGLDLTPWIEESGGVYGIWQVVEIMVVIVSFISVFAIPVAFVITVGSSILAGKTDNYYGKRAMRWLGILLASIIVFLGSNTLMNTLDDNDPESRFDYIAQHYGVSDLYCNEDWESDGERYDCSTTITNPDMDTLSTSEPTRELTLIIRDDRAYLYDENGKLMQVNQ